MIYATDPITISVPRTILSGIVELSAELRDRMHELLERNTDGALSPVERSELETLVRMAEFGQLVALAMNPRVAS